MSAGQEDTDGVMFGNKAGEYRDRKRPKPPDANDYNTFTLRTRETDFGRVFHGFSEGEESRTTGPCLGVTVLDCTRCTKLKQRGMGS